MAYVASKVSEPEFERASALPPLFLARRASPSLTRLRHLLAEAVAEIRSTLGPLFAKRPELEKAFEGESPRRYFFLAFFLSRRRSEPCADCRSLNLAVLKVPERVITFRVVWEDDKVSPRGLYAPAARLPPQSRGISPRLHHSPRRAYR